MPYENNVKIIKIASFDKKINIRNSWIIEYCEINQVLVNGESYFNIKFCVRDTPLACCSGCFYGELNEDILGFELEILHDVKKDLNVIIEKFITSEKEKYIRNIFVSEESISKFIDKMNIKCTDF